MFLTAYSIFHIALTPMLPMPVQTEKQRLIWAYKILFLDVLFPLNLRKVIFCDSDQVVRGDMAELWNMDLKVVHHSLSLSPSPSLLLLLLHHCPCHYIVTGPCCCHCHCQFHNS